MGKHSGRNALSTRLKELGFELSNNEVDDVFRRFKALADKKKVRAVNPGQTAAAPPRRRAPTGAGARFKPGVERAAAPRARPGAAGRRPRGPDTQRGGDWTPPPLCPSQLPAAAPHLAPRCLAAALPTRPAPRGRARPPRASPTTTCSPL
jgi:hypothetical protein